MKDTLHCTIIGGGKSQLVTCGEPTCSGNADGHPFTEIKCNRLHCLIALSSHPWQSEFGRDRILICPTSRFCTRNLGDTTGHSPSCVLRRAKTSHEKPFFKAFSFELYMWNTCNPTVLFILALQGYPIGHNFCEFTDALRVEPSLVKPRTGFQNIKMKTCGNLMTPRCRIG